MRSRKQNCETNLHALAETSPVGDAARVEAEGMKLHIDDSLLAEALTDKEADRGG